MAQRALTGIKPTGAPHVGNWLAAIRPALALAHDFDTFYFIADYHALTVVHDPESLRRDTLAIAASYLSFGLDPEKSVFYRQSDVPEIFELAWVLACFTPKGFMNRAHAYKDLVARNSGEGKDPDYNLNMGLFSYPVLMAADILMFNADVVPVGQDQKQHLEFARDIAEKFNHNYSADVFVLPEPRIEAHVKVIPGLDGRKMSKSYGNTIPLFVDEKQLSKMVNRIVTNSQGPDEPKDPDQSTIFALHRLLLESEEEVNRLKVRYMAGGLGWGQAKKDLFECLNAKLSGPREEYYRLMQDKAYLESVLRQGKARARAVSQPCMEKVRKTIGIA